jgi:hypothetical protein
MLGPDPISQPRLRLPRTANLAQDFYRQELADGAISCDESHNSSRGGAMGFIYQVEIRDRYAAFFFHSVRC